MAHTSDRQLVSPGSRPITLVRRRVSPKVRSTGVGVPDPAVVLDRETQIAGELLAVGEQAAHRRGVGLAVLLGEAVDPRLDGVDEPLPRLQATGDEVVGVEQRPVGVLHLLLGTEGTLARTLRSL